MHVLFGRGLSAGLQALTLILVARSVTPSEFGLFGGVLAAVSPIVYLADFGTQSLALRQRARPESRTAALETMYTQRVLTLASATISALLLWTLVLLGFLPAWSVLFPVMLLLEKEVSGALGIALSDGRSLVQLVLPGLQRVSTLIIVASALGLGAGNAITAYLIAAIFSGVMSVITIYSLGPKYRRPPVSLVRHQVRDGLAFWAATLSHQIRSMDVMLVAVFASSLQAGLYAFPSKVSGPLRIAATSLSSVALPVAAKGDLVELRSLDRMMRWVSWITAVLLSLVVIFAEQLIVLVVGAAYREAAWPLRLVAVGLMLNVPGSYISGVLQGLGRQRFVGLLGLWLALAAVVLVSVGSWAFGAVGAAGGIAVVYVVQFFAVLAASRRWRPSGGGES